MGEELDRQVAEALSPLHLKTALIPRFSTDIAAAFAVVEWMRELTGRRLSLEDQGQKWVAIFKPECPLTGDADEKYWWDFAPTPAEAICKAALAAVKGGSDGTQPSDA